jgi:hypothetical protein
VPFDKLIGGSLQNNQIVLTSSTNILLYNYDGQNWSPITQSVTPSAITTLNAISGDNSRIVTV